MSWGTGQDRQLGQTGRKSNFVNAQNQLGQKEYQQEQATKRFYEALTDAVSQPSPPVGYPPPITSGSSGSGLTIFLLLGVLALFGWAYPYALKITGDSTWAFVLMGAGFLLGLCLLWLLWKCFQLALLATAAGLDLIWETLLGKIIIIAGFIVGGSYGANRFFGQAGLEYFVGFLIIVGGLRLAFGVLAWFASTRIGRVVVPTFFYAIVYGGIVIAGVYIYTIMFP